jgi:methylated-DNA-protein-cysteine methyltransferase-like protein
MLKKLALSSVSLIPKGRISTYGDIAAALGNPNLARAVGNILHGNLHPGKIPCHRVIHADGSLSRSFAFGGIAEQRRLLKSEGVPFAKNGKVDLRRAKRRVF